MMLRRSLLFCLLSFALVFAQGVPGEMQRAFDLSHDFDADITMNPASIARLDQTRLTISYFPLFTTGDYVNYFSAAQPVMEKITVGVARLEIGMNDIVEMDGMNRATGNFFSDRQILYLLTGAQALSDQVSMGVTLKFARQMFFNKENRGWGVDIGLRYIPIKNTIVGMGVHNFILRPNLQLDRDEVTWPTSAWAEVAYRGIEHFEFRALLGSEDLLVAEEEYDTHMPLDLLWKASVSYYINDQATVLMATAAEDIQAGFSYRHTLFKLSYFCSYHYHLGLTYRTTLDLSYGHSRDEKETKSTFRSKKKNLKKEIKKAKQLLRKGNYWRAAQEYGKLRAGTEDTLQENYNAGLALSLRGMGLHYAAEKALAHGGKEALETSDVTAMLYTRLKQAIRMQEVAHAKALFAQIETSDKSGAIFNNALYDMAIFARRMGKAEDIPALLKEIHPSSACYMYAQYWLGQIAYQQSDADEAIHCFDNIIACKPLTQAQKIFRYKAQQKAGHIFFELGRYDEAYERYARALGNAYRKDETLIGIAWTFFKEEEYERALGAAEQLLKKYQASPYAVEAYLISAYSYLVLDYYVEALEAFDYAFKSAIVSGIDSAAAATEAVSATKKIRAFNNDLKSSEEHLVSYLTDPALVNSTDAQEKLRNKIDIIQQKITGLEHRITMYRKSVARDRIAKAVRQDAEYGLAMVDGLLKEAKMKMMQKAYEHKMNELEHMMDEVK